MGDPISPNLQFQGPASLSFTSGLEASQNEGANGQAAPPGTTPVEVAPGDTISGLMASDPYNLDWNNPEQRAQFLADNPQFSDVGDRNPDLIWPGEVVYVRTVSPSQTTDQAAADLANLEEQYGETSSGSSVRAAEHRSEVLAEGQQKVKDAAYAELASGATADEIIERHGGDNASPRIEAAVREAATDYAAQQLLAAQDSGNPEAINQAQAALNDAITAEIEADSYGRAIPSGGEINREAHGKGAISAGDSISTRLEEMGVTGQASNVQQLAQTVSDSINNET